MPGLINRGHGKAENKMVTRLILVGGFLGAGKTTLLETGAKKLTEKGLNAGLITNDQAPQLVDTAFLSLGGKKVKEVSGSCFCCNLNGLMDAVDHFRVKEGADIILAEPVGSCTDLSATIIQPFKDRMEKELVVAPLSVLVDPSRLSGILEGSNAGLHPDAAYILRKQLEEADIVILSKSDTIDSADLSFLEKEAARLSHGADIFSLSARTGEGVDLWLNTVLERSDAGRKILKVDYDRYAKGEAVLGWLNATLGFSANHFLDWKRFAQDFLELMGQDFDRRGASVGHVKLLISDSRVNGLTGNLTGPLNKIDVRGNFIQGAVVTMTLNARVEMAPGQLEERVKNVLECSIFGKTEMKILDWRCFSPGRPNPTQRYDTVVNYRG